jgi:arylsulfatase A-like enzyme
MKADVFARMFGLLLIPAAFALGSEATTQPAGPNIIVFYTSGQMSGLTGFEGGKVVKTPNLDRLAAEGVQFTRCYVSCPQPGPSRAGFLTGLYPHENGVTNSGDALPETADTFTARLKKAGYTCGIVGKWDLPAKSAAKPGFGLTDFVATNKAPGKSEADHENGSPANGGAARSHAQDAGRPAGAGMSPMPVATSPAQGPRAPGLPPSRRMGAPFAAASQPATRPGFDRGRSATDRPVGSAPLANGKPESNADAKDAGKSGWERPSVYLNGKKKRVDEYLTDWQANQACEFLKKSRKKPFFLWVCFDAPHPPFEYPPGDEKAYPLGSVDLPSALATPNMAQQLAMSSAAAMMRQKNPQELREERSKYYAMLSRVDENVGRVLARLAELKLADNTVVVFTSDSGWPIGDHALYGEAPAFYEETLRVPLVVRTPACSATGKRVSAVSSAIDLAPTFCELAGLKSPITMRGRSLVPMLQESARAEVVDERFFEFEQVTDPNTKKPYKAPARGIVTAQYKLIHYVNGADVLYDLKRDPQEATNVIGETRYAPVAKVLRERLTRWRKETRDPVRN